MKALIVSESYPPTEGGVSTSTQRISQNLHRLGIDVHVYCFDNTYPINGEDHYVEENDRGVLITKFGPFFVKQRSISLRDITHSERAILRRRVFDQMISHAHHQQFDVVMGFYLFDAGHLGLLLAREIKVPFVAAVRGNDIGENIFNAEKFGITRWIIEYADAVVCVNEYLKNRLLIAFPGVNTKTTVIPNSINELANIQDKATCRQKVGDLCGWNKIDLRLTFIGSLREKKGIFVLLKALSILRAELSVRLLVIGPEPKPSSLKTCETLWKDLVESGSICVTGSLNRIEVLDWALGCDAIIMPSLDDGMANGLLEGMALGLCPIVSSVFKDVVNDEVNGYVVERGNVAQLMIAIKKLAFDRERLHSLGDNARISSTQWTPQNEANAYKAIFLSLIEKETI